RVVGDVGGVAAVAGRVATGVPTVVTGADRVAGQLRGDRLARRVVARAVDLADAHGVGAVVVGQQDRAAVAGRDGHGLHERAGVVVDVDVGDDGVAAAVEGDRAGADRDVTGDDRQVQPDVGGGVEHHDVADHRGRVARRVGDGQAHAVVAVGR